MTPSLCRPYPPEDVLSIPAIAARCVEPDARLWAILTADRCLTDEEQAYVTAAEERGQ